MDSRLLPAAASIGTCLLVLSVVACEDEVTHAPVAGTCEELAERFAECGGGPSDNDSFVPWCQRYPKDFVEVRTCVGQSVCGAFSKCADEAFAHADPRRRTLRMRRLVEAIDLAEARGDWDEVERMCEIVALDPDPRSAHTGCTGIAERAVRRLTVELERVRDDPGRAPTHLDHCGRLRGFARRLGPSASRDADRTCLEAAVAVDAQRLFDEVQRRVAEGPAEIPQRCAPMLRRLGGIPTPRAQHLQGKLAEACYVMLGRKILDDARARTCPASVRRVLEGLTRHRLTSAAEIATLASTFATVCGP